MTFFPDLQSVQSWVYPISRNLTVLYSACKNNHLQVALLPLAYFFKQNIFKVHQYYSIYQSFTTFYEWAKFYCVNFTFCFSSNLSIIIFSYIWIIINAVVVNSDVLISKFLLSVSVVIYLCVKLLDHMLIYFLILSNSVFLQDLQHVTCSLTMLTYINCYLMSTTFFTFHF